jgi:outer membrane protein TolC
METRTKIITIIGIVLAVAAGLFPNSVRADKADAPPSFVIDNNTITLPLQSILIHALKNNLDITFSSLQPDISETDILREKGYYDTLISSQFNKTFDRKQVGNALTGSSASADIYQERHIFDASVQKRFTTGTLAELRATHQEFRTDLPFQGLKPEYWAEIALSLTQPLLRDFGIDVGTSMIRISALNHEISTSEFRQNVMDVLFQVESIYWDLYYRIDDLDAKKRSLDRANKLVREFKIRIDAGTLAPIEIYQAEAEAALRSQEVIVAQSLVQNAEDNLKAALNLYDDEAYWAVRIRPKDKPPLKKIIPEITSSVQEAFEKRPDFKQAQLGVKAANIQIKYTKNQTLPRLDLIGSIGTTGLAGRPQDTSGVFGPFFRSTPSPWKGHWDSVYDGLADKDYYNYLIGVKIEFPLENRIAKSQFSKAKIQRMQALTNLKRRESSIITEVKDAIRQVTDSYKVIEAARTTVLFNQEKLKAQEKKFEVGMSTAYDLLSFQEDLAKAESSLAAAQAKYAQSLANYARVKGVLLEEKGLTL